MTRTGRALAAVPIVILVVTTLSLPAGASPADPLLLAGAISSESGVVTGSSYVTVPPQSTPTLVATSSIPPFPTDGSSFAILSTGDATLAGTPNNAPNSGVNAGG